MRITLLYCTEPFHKREFNFILYPESSQRSEWRTGYANSGTPFIMISWLFDGDEFFSGTMYVCVSYNNSFTWFRELEWLLIRLLRSYALFIWKENSIIVMKLFINFENAKNRIKNKNKKNHKPKKHKVLPKNKEQKNSNTTKN